MGDPNLQFTGESSSATFPTTALGVHRWAKMSLISSVACWVSFVLAFVIPFLAIPLLMSVVMTPTYGSSDISTTAPAQAATFISIAAVSGYPIGMVLGLIGLVAGIAALRKIGADQSMTRSKNMALAGAVLGGASVVLTCLLLSGAGIWFALWYVMSTSGS